MFFEVTPVITLPDERRIMLGSVRYELSEFHPSMLRDGSDYIAWSPSTWEATVGLKVEFRYRLQSSEVPQPMIPPTTPDFAQDISRYE